MRVLGSEKGAVQLDEKAALGSGGRGNVVAVSGEEVTDVCGRTYKVACKLLADGYRSEGRRAKIDHLAKIGETATVCAAWPLEKVYDDRAWVGFTMRRLHGKTLDEVCADARTKLKMKVDLAARACGIVVDMHALGIVIGDVSMTNFMYNRSQDLLGMVDLDSVQVIDHEAGVVYPAAESLEKSPEMANAQLGDTVLTSQSDDFLAAVMVFRMLFGAHPLDSFETDCSPAEIRERNACQRRFPYRRLSGVLPVNAFGQQLADLFRRSFEGPYEQVPTAQDYQRALVEIVRSGFMTCPTCSNEYAKAAGTCPHCACQRQKRNGGSVRTAFVVVLVAAVVLAYASGFDVLGAVDAAVSSGVSLIDGAIVGFGGLGEMVAGLLEILDVIVGGILGFFGGLIEGILGFFGDILSLLM